MQGLVSAWPEWPRVPLALKGRGQAQDPSRLPGTEWVGEMLGMFPHILQFWRFPPHSPLLFSPCLPPPTHLGPTQPEGAPEGGAQGPETQQAS